MSHISLKNLKSLKRENTKHFVIKLLKQILYKIHGRMKNKNKYIFKKKKAKVSRELSTKTIILFESNVFEWLLDKFYCTRMTSSGYSSQLLHTCWKQSWWHLFNKLFLLCKHNCITKNSLYFNFRFCMSSFQILCAFLKPF